MVALKLYVDIDVKSKETSIHSRNNDNKEQVKSAEIRTTINRSEDFLIDLQKPIYHHSTGSYVSSQ
jgi:hypothetical protein